MGYLWIGTEDGLNRFDGNEFRIYRSLPENPSSISANSISIIFEDSQNRLWIGTNQGGINLMDRETDTFTQFLNDPMDSSTISENSVTGITEDHDGNIWISTYYGLNKLIPETGDFVRYYESSEAEGPLSNILYGLLVDEGQLFIAHARGVSILDLSNESFKHIQNDPSSQITLSKGQVTSICRRNENEIWLGTDESGLNLFNKKTGQITNYTHDESDPNSIPSNSINSLFMDWNGNTWINTENKGISIFKDNAFHRLVPTNNFRFADASVLTIHEGKDKVWIGTYAEGIYQFSKTGINFIHETNYHPIFETTEKNSVLSFAEDRFGKLWIGTDGSGLFKYDPVTETYTSYRTQAGRNSISSDVIKTLLFDKYDNLLIGTYLGGLDYLDTKSGQIKNYNSHNSNLESNSVWALVEDENQVWIGTLNGLYQMDSESREIRAITSDIQNPKAYPSAYTSCALRTSDGSIWLGTAVGLVRYLPAYDEFERFDERNSNLASGDIKSMMEARNGDLWLVTSIGISRFITTTGGFVNLDMRGKITTQARSILEDDNGNLWLSTLNGIYKLDASGEIIAQFDLSDGLQGKEFNAGAALRGSNGIYYFGGLNGYNVFDAEEVVYDNGGPSVVFSDLLLFNEPVEPGNEPFFTKTLNYQKSLFLPYDKNYLSITYSAIDFNFPKSIEYAYMLDGFEDDWNYVEEKNMATYTNLPAGNYTFTVKAKKRYGEWTIEPKTVNIFIETPFWQTNWFYITAATSLLFLITFVFRWRTNTLILRSEKLETHVKQRTDALRDEVENRKKTENELRKTVNQLKHAQHQLVTKEKMASVGVLTAGIAHELNNPLNFIAGGLNILKSEFDKDRIPMKELEERMSRNDDLKLVYAVRLIDEGFQRSHMVVKSLTSLSNKEQPVMMITDLSEMIDFILDKMADEIEGVEVEKEIMLTSIVVLMDRLQQVLINIIENAIEATKTNNHKNPKKIKISTEKVLEKGEEKAIISIFNTGLPINEKILPRVFDPFFTTKEQGTGYGLGLSTAYSFIEQQGGTITVDNVKNGVLFTVKLPYVEISD